MSVEIINGQSIPNMPWQDQRKWLLQISGDVTDMDVIAADPKLKPMENLIAKHSVEDVKAMAANQLKLANKTVKEDMVRIDQTAVLAGNATESDLEAQITREVTSQPVLTAGQMKKVNAGSR